METKLSFLIGFDWFYLLPFDPRASTSHFIHSMTLASARVQSFLNVQIVVWMAKQSARMITPVVNSLIKIIIKVKTKIDAMAVAL